jgi:DNA damage-binding protein 1
VAKSRRLEIRQLRTSLSSSSSSSEAVAAAATAGESSSVNNNDNNVNGASSPFPVLVSVPINGRITSLVPIYIPSSPTALVFMTTDRFRYAVVSYDATHGTSAATGGTASNTAAAAAASSSSCSSSSPYPLVTHASGSIKGEDYNILGREAEAGPLVAVDASFRCIAMHVYDGIISILPIDASYSMPNTTTATAYKGTGTAAAAAAAMSSSSRRNQVLQRVFHCRIEERKLLAMTFLQYQSPPSSESSQQQQQPMPLLCLLYMDARGVQHMTTHVVNLQKKQFHYHGSNSVSAQSSPTDWLRKSSVDGGSSMLIAVPPPKSAAMPSPPVAAAAAAANSTAAGNNKAVNNNTMTTTGGVIIIGQRQFTYCSSTTTKTIPVPQALFLTYEELPADPNVAGGMPRYLLGDEFGNLHMLTIMTVASSVAAAAASADGNATSAASSNSAFSAKVVGFSLDTLGSCTLSTSLAYLGGGLVHVGSALGDSQLVQIHDEPIPVDEAAAAVAGASAAAARGADQPGDEDLDEDDRDVLLDTTYIHVVEEYTNLGPILDFDLVPTNPGSGNNNNANSSNAGAGTATVGGNTVTAAASQQQQQQHPNVQCQVVTASGSSKSGSLRLIRNGIGMNEYAAVEIPGIHSMWSLRKSFRDKDDGYLVQSFVGETRVLGVSSSSNTNSIHNMDIGDENDDAMEEDRTGRGQDDDDDDGEDVSGGVGTLEEVDLPGLESMAPSLYVGNVQLGDRYLQITKSAVRLFARASATALFSSSSTDALLLDSWSGPITVAAANEAGQIAVALSGGMVLYFCVSGDNGEKLEKKLEKQMGREVCCLDLHPLVPSDPDDMEVEQPQQQEFQTNRTAVTSALLAVGLWEDFTVRILSLENSLDELVKIRLSTQEDEDGGEDAVGTGQPRRNRTNMMARSLSLLTLDFSSNLGSGAGSHNAGGGGNTNAPGVDMLFVGLGDGTLISFAVVSRDGKVTVQSKKEVCLGTQRIDLVPLSTAQGGTCILATGDRPTVIYLAGVGGTSANQFNPKLCYSSVNLSTSEDEDGDDVSRPPSQQSIAVNVAAPFFSPLLFDTASLRNQHYSLCVADDSSLRLGVIDDIQKLHVTTCRLGMAPRRIVHCIHGRLFAVGCVESGIKHFGLGGAEATSMANCIRFMDDTNFDDIHRVDLEAYEQVLSMVYVSLKVPSKDGTLADGSTQGAQYKPFLLVGTGYALPDENEPTRGRIIVYSCQADEAAATSTNRSVREVAQHSTTGGVYSMSQFYEGTALCTVNSKTMIGQLVDDAGTLKFSFIGM